MLRTLLLLLCAAAMLPAHAFASSVPSSMRVALVSDPAVSILPLQVMDRDFQSMLDLVYESLVTLDDSRRPAPGLATSWSQTSNGASWTFSLREDVRFHDGRELTAYDVAATMDAIKALAGDLESAATAENGPYANTARVCKSWKADDKYTLTVQTSRPTSLLYAMTFPVLQAQSVMQPNPPGTGPYRVAYFNPGEELWLVGNEDWYGPSPHISQITGVFFDTIENAMRAYETENIDIFMTRSTSAIRYRGTGTALANSYDYSTQQLEMLLINNGARMFKENLSMRKAIAHAINKTRLTANVYQNMVTATDTLQSPASWLYNDSIDPYTYSPELANQLLDEAGWASRNESGQRIRRTESGETQPLVIRLFYYDEAGSALRKEAANEIATMLRALNIRVTITGLTFENGLAKLKSGDYDLFLCSYNFDIVPDPSFLLLSNGYGNYARYRSDDINKLCNELRKSIDEDTLKRCWNEIQRIVYDDVPFIPLYWRGGVVLTRYPYSSVRDIREYRVLHSINLYK